MRKVWAFIFVSLWIFGCNSQNTADPQNPPQTNSGSNNNNTNTSHPNTSSSDLIPLTQDNWTIVYDGFGNVSFDANSGITLQPAVAANSSDTHAALILAKKTETCPVKDFILTIKAQTQAQLRSPNPNPWEVFWIFFNYLPVGNNKTTNYFILKPEGIELGRAFDVVGQEFLFTDNQPVLAIGTSYEYSLEKKGGNLVVKINGNTVLNYTSQQFPQALYDQAGSIGLYTEDAKVLVESVSLTSLDAACP